jgi:PKHD-type hydroxylase
MIFWVPQHAEPRWKNYIVKTTKPVLTPQQCDELIRIGQSEPKMKGETTYKGKKMISEYRKSTIAWVPINKAIPIYQVIKQSMEKTNNNHFGFDTIQFPGQGQYAEYSKGGFYDWHMDTQVEMLAMPAVRKISMTLLLNNPKEFEGGDLEIFCGNKLNSQENKIKLKQGDAVFFASFLLHRVIPVIKGNRKSLVMWFGGTPLK